MASSTPEVSVVLPFRNHEEQVGRACRRLAEHFAGLSFEIIAVNEGSTDNSQSVISLLRHEIPQIKLALSQGRGRGYAAGSARAKGGLLILLTPEMAADRPLAPLARAVRRVSCGELDMVLVEQRLVVCRRNRCDGLLQRRRQYQDRLLVRRAQGRGLAVESYRLRGDMELQTPLSRLFTGVTTLRHKLL